jgi:hypothetical protein
MARIVLGMGVSHTPQLHTTAEQWEIRVQADQKNPAHLFRGRRYTFAEIVALREAENLAAEITLEKRQARLHAGHKALDKLAAVYERVKPDVAVVVGNDQHELFADDIMPAFTIYWGEQIENRPRTKDQVARLPVGIHLADAGHVPPEMQIYPGLPGLGRHIIEHCIREEFDVAHSKTLPQVDDSISILSGIPHAYGFVYRQIMRDQVIPNVPVILNTFYPPNQPTVSRCFHFGAAIGRAIASWDADKTVGIFASGGLSHFVVDADFDRAFLDALKNSNVAALTSPGEAMYQSGTSECKNWITAAGILSTTSLKMQVVDYLPFYRSLAGTGTGTAYALWQ